MVMSSMETNNITKSFDDAANSIPESAKTMSEWYSLTPAARRSENSTDKNKTRIAATRKNRLKNNASASSTNEPLKAVPKTLQMPSPPKLTSNKPPSAAIAA